MSFFIMLLMMVIENPVLIFYTVTVMLHSTQEHIVFHLNQFWGPLLKSADARYPSWDQKP